MPVAAHLNLQGGQVGKGLGIGSGLRVVAPRLELGDGVLESVPTTVSTRRDHSITNQRDGDVRRWLDRLGRRPGVCSTVCSTVIVIVVIVRWYAIGGIRAREVVI
jgi:hypothetical protein